MRARIPRISYFRGSIAVPGDKSLAHRALMLAALADGASVIANLPAGRDVLATRLALEKLDVKIEDLEPGAVKVHGTGRFSPPDSPIDCMNSGTTIRLLTGLLAGAGVKATLTGDESLRRRPMERVAAPLRRMGARIDTTNSRPPITVADRVHRPFRHTLEIASAQVKSAILLAGLFAGGTTEVVEPLPSRDHTERFLEYLGVPVFRSERASAVYGQARPRPFTVTLPGDPSSASFLAAVALLSNDGCVTIPDVLFNERRLGFFRAIEKMGAAVVYGDAAPSGPEMAASLTIHNAALSGCVIDGSFALDALDELPLLAVLGAFASGETMIRDAKELRHKESDRIASTARLIRALGGEVEEFEDGLRVRGGLPLHGGLIEADGDHRIALAAAVAGSRIEGVEVEGYEAADVSFPGFLDILRTHGANP